MTKELTIEQWRAIWKEEGLRIDPKTAEIECQTPDRFGEEVAWEYFARAPGSDIWVPFDYLPAATVEALCGRPEPSITIENGSVRRTVWRFHQT